jgi:hypothetical protein
VRTQQKLMTGALAALAALAVSGCTPSGPKEGGASPSPTGSAQQSPTRLDPNALRSVLPPKEARPVVAEMQELSLQQAVTDKVLQLPSDVVVAPADCGRLLTIALGDAGQATGWVQVGTNQPSGTRGGDPFVTLVARVPGGAKLDRLRDTVTACRSGTITLTAVGVVGTIRLTEVKAPALSGAQTFGIEQIVTFPSNIPEAARRAVADGPLTTTHIFVSMNELLMDSCQVEVVAAVDLANVLHSRALLMLK